MKIKNHQLESFIVFLDQSLDLEGINSRMRTRFKNLLIEKLQLYLTERMEIGRKYSKKDAHGNPMTKELDGNEVFDIEDETTSTKELLELINEDVVIDETEERKQMLLSVKHSITSCPLKFKGKPADEYDIYCDVVEGIEYI